MSNSLVFLSKNNLPLTTSLIIAERLDIQHKNILHNIDKFSKELQTINPLAFGTRKGEPLPQGGYSKSTRYALLTEEQAAFVITLSRNTPKVVEFKLALTKAFFEAREALNKSKVENKIEHQSYLKIFKDFCLQHNYSSEELKMFDYLRDQAVKQGYAIACAQLKERVKPEEAEPKEAPSAKMLKDDEIAIPKATAKHIYEYLDWISKHRKEMMQTASDMREQSKVLMLAAEGMLVTRSLVKDSIFNKL